jgi:hypothetical protein
MSLRVRSFHPGMSLFLLFNFDFLLINEGALH